MGIFKAYDIRGKYPSELNEDIARKIGNGVARVIGKGPIVVSRDMRLSSPAIARAVVEGVTDAGVDVVDCGLLSSPANSFAVANYGFPGGIQVTASHNPSDYTGFKVSREDAIPVGYDTGLADVEKMIEADDYVVVEDKGAVSQRDVAADFTAHILKFAEDIGPLKVVIDASNGMQGMMAPPVFAKLRVSVIPMFFDLDGSFPNHEPNPLKLENLEPLRKRVVAEGADLGAMFDGDGDRCALIDEKGRVVPCDLLTAVIAREILEREKGAAIIYDLRSSKAASEEIAKYGGKPIRERVGHAFIKARMRKENAPFGGELSGHYYFRDHFFADSGLLALIKVLNLLSAQRKSLSELVDPLRRYCSTGEINFRVDDQDAKIRQIAEQFSDGEIDYLDGITVDYGDWWFNVRKSNTEPVLRLVLEGKTAQLAEEGKARVLALLGTPEASGH